MKRTAGERAFQIIDILFVFFIIICIVIPFWNVVCISVSGVSTTVSSGLALWPRQFTFTAYSEIIGSSLFLRSLINTVFLTALHTAAAVLLTVIVAYAFTREFPGKKWITAYFVFSMYFSGGLIPTYIVYSKYYHLRNTYLLFLITGLVSFFYVIVVRSQIEATPVSLYEAAAIDGASEPQIVFRITVPVIMPTIAAISMFFALSMWNEWFNVMVYTDQKKFWTLQYYLRAVVFDKMVRFNDTNAVTLAEADEVPPENYRMASIILAALPIIAIYPFVQKYFVKGLLTGAVKG